MGAHADWSGASAAWATLPQAEKQAYADEVKDAKDRASVLGIGHDIFGEKASRTKARIRRQAQAKALAKLAEDIDPCTEQAINASIEELPEMLSLQALRKTATALERKNHGVKQHRDRLAKAKVQAWSSKQSLCQLTELTGLENESFDLQPGLHNGFIASHSSSSRASTASKLIGYLSACRKGSQNLSAAMLYSWALKARTVLESEAALVYEPVHAELVADEDAAARKTHKPKKKPFCWQVGICLCDEQGKLIWQMSQLLLATIKSQFPFTSSYRLSHLKMSKVFVLLRSCKPDQDPGTAPWTSSILLHIGIQYLTPFRPTFRLCELQGDADSDAAIPLTGTNEYLCLFPSLMRKLGAELDASWFARFYFISERGKPFPAMDVSKAWMTPVQRGMADFYGNKFWPPRRRGAGQGKADDGDDGLDGGLLALADAESDCDPGEGIPADEDVLDDLVEECAVSIAFAGGDDDEAPDAPPPSAHHPSSDDSSSSSGSGIDSDSDDKDDDVGGAKEKADIVLTVAGGSIRYYATTAQFTATCNEGHGKCILTRQATASKLVKAATVNPNLLAKGRPLGTLVAWLQWGCMCADKDAHFDKHSMQSNLTYELRSAARASLSDTIKGRALLAKERHKRSGEGDEPEVLA